MGIAPETTTEISGWTGLAYEDPRGVDIDIPGTRIPGPWISSARDRSGIRMPRYDELEDYDGAELKTISSKDELTEEQRRQLGEMLTANRLALNPVMQKISPGIAKFMFELARRKAKAANWREEVGILLTFAYPKNVLRLVGIKIYVYV